MHAFYVRSVQDSFSEIYFIFEGNSGGWCADPRLNNVTQYLQVDFRQLQEVCRVAMQGQQNSRNWITHYKVAFSLDGRHWSIYKEVGKEKVCSILK